MVAAQEEVSIAVKIVGAGLGDGVNDHAGSFAVFGGVVGGENGELLDGIDAEVDAERTAGRAVGVVVDADAVHAVVVLKGAVTGVGHLASEAAVSAADGGRAGLRLRL